MLTLFFAVYNPVAVWPQSPRDSASWFDEGKQAMVGEDWYGAAEDFLECLRMSSAHAEATLSLAECYYQLGEFDQALSWARKARTLARANMAAANLEASTLIALGRLDEAAVIINDILKREPYNREALFAAAELDVGRGRTADAFLKLRDAGRRYRDDRRLLVSLALVAGSLGDRENARRYIGQALEQNPGDYRVYYYAAYLDAQDGRILPGITYAADALYYKPGFKPAISLLASLRYRNGEYEEAARLADELIAADRSDALAWYLKGISYNRLGRAADAVAVLSTAAAVAPNDEFIRAALEDIIIAATPLEDPVRAQWAAWHFGRAKDFRSRNLTDQAIFEYRRGLRLNPYAIDRKDYAELLRLRGYPGRYVEELRFMQSQKPGGKETADAARLSDTAHLSDAIEAYQSVLEGTMETRWNVDPLESSKRHWKVAVFSVAGQSSYVHTDAGAVVSAYVKDLLTHDRNIQCLDLELRQPEFSWAFRTAREAGADYFLVINVSESGRDLSIKADMYVGRTGSAAGSFSVYRTGGDRLRNAARGIISQLDGALPFRADLVRRRQGTGLMGKGRADGVEDGVVYEVVKKGAPITKNEGIGLVYTKADVVGTFTVNSLGEEIAAGALARSGFFDNIAEGDEIILKPEEPKSDAADGTAAKAKTTDKKDDKKKAENKIEGGPQNPELEALLRTLR